MTVLRGSDVEQPGILQDLSVTSAAHPYPAHMKDTGKQSHSDRLAEAMAASAVSRANGGSKASVQTLRQRRGKAKATDTCESQDMGLDTVQEKTLEFFQMCDIENKGFITRRDMQVSDKAMVLVSADHLKRNILLTDFNFACFF